MGFILFLRGISMKVNVILRLEFEHIYFEAAIQNFNYYAMGTSSNISGLMPNLLNLFSTHLTGWSKWKAEEW